MMTHVGDNEKSQTKNNIISELKKRNPSPSESKIELENNLLVEGIEAFQETLVRKKSATLLGAKAFKAGLKK